MKTEFFFLLWLRVVDPSRRAVRWLFREILESILLGFGAATPPFKGVLSLASEYISFLPPKILTESSTIPMHSYLNLVSRHTILLDGDAAKLLMEKFFT